MGLLGFREPFAAPLPPGLGADGRHEDVEDEGQRRGPRRRSSRAHGADAVRLYILFMGPADQDMEWTPAGIEGIGALPAAAVAARARGRRARGRRPARRTRRSRARRTRRSRRSPTTSGGASRTTPPISAIMELVNELSRRHRRPGRAVRRRDGGQPHPALRAARRRGAVGRARPRAAVGGAVAGGRPGDARARDVRARRPGERPRARPHRGRGDPVRRRARRAGQGLGEGAGTPGRQGDPPDDRRAAASS